MARPIGEIDPRMRALGHCEHCYNSFGVWACREAEHLEPCKRCGAVKEA